MLKEIIDKWRLNQNLLAEKMGMPKGTFNNKLSGTHTSKFSNEELDKLKAILVELRSDLEGIDAQDFNEALKILSQKEV